MRHCSEQLRSDLFFLFYCVLFMLLFASNECVVASLVDVVQQLKLKAQLG